MRVQTFLPLVLVSLMASPVQADYQSDRQWSYLPLDPRVQRLYLGKTSSNECRGWRVEECIKKCGEAHERRRVSGDEERLICFGKKILYRGTGSANSAVGPEWHEYIVRDGKVVDEFKVVQVMESGYPWMPPRVEDRHCEVYGGKNTISCGGRLTAVGSIPERPASLSEQLKTFQVYIVIISKRACDKAVPGFRQRAATAYAKWRLRSQELVRIIGERAFPPVQEEFQALHEYGLTRSITTEDCDDLLADLEGATRPPDPKLSTPEKTWETLLAALRQGDSRTAIACFSPIARRKWRREIVPMSRQGMKDKADSIKSLELTQRFGEFREGIAVRHDGILFPIYFEKLGEEWKISSM